MYEYKCDCGNEFTKICKFSGSRNVKCQCGKRAKKLISLPSIITDTNFFYTGKYDTRLGSRIEGRKDFWKKAEAKGLHEAPNRDFAVTTTLEDRIKNIPEPI